MSRVFVGTYTDPSAHSGHEVTAANPVMGMTGLTGSTGIYIFENADAGEWTLLSRTANIVNPAFVALSHDGTVLFAVNETMRYEGAETGAVSSFAIDPATQTLQLLSQQPSGGGLPCHIWVAPSGRWLLVANYQAATLTVLPIDAEGRLGQASQVFQDAPDATSGTKPSHAHFIRFDPAGERVVATNIGTDRVRVFQFDDATGTLTPNDPPWGQVHPGGSPRHLDFHPSGEYLFVDGEADRTLSVFRYDQATGALTYLGHKSTLPPDAPAGGSTAHMLVHPNGKAIYVGNRGIDTIAVFTFDAATGEITLEQNAPIGAPTPRFFTLSPDGNLLYVGQQNNDTIVRFAVDPETGLLGERTVAATVPAPTCIVFAE